MMSKPSANYQLILYFLLGLNRRPTAVSQEICCEHPRAFAITPKVVCDGDDGCANDG